MRFRHFIFGLPADVRECVEAARSNLRRIWRLRGAGSKGWVIISKLTSKTKRLQQLIDHRRVDQPSTGAVVESQLIAQASACHCWPRQTYLSVDGSRERYASAHSRMGYRWRTIERTIRGRAQGKEVSSRYVYMYVVVCEGIGPSAGLCTVRVMETPAPSHLLVRLLFFHQNSYRAETVC